MSEGHSRTLSFVILAVSFAVFVHRFPPGDSLYAASADKMKLLQTQTSPRSIFVGGSSMAFGMDSGLVASRHGFHPVNMGLHLGIGLEFMLQQVEPLVRSGDVVVVSPWYMGTSFQRYYSGPPDWVAVPPIQFVRFQRFDLLLGHMMAPTQALLPVLERMQNVLSSGHRVWHVGNLHGDREPMWPLVPAPNGPFAMTPFS